MGLTDTTRCAKRGLVGPQCSYLSPTHGWKSGAAPHKSTPVIHLNGAVCHFQARLVLVNGPDCVNTAVVGDCSRCVQSGVKGRQDVAPPWISHETAPPTQYLQRAKHLNRALAPFRSDVSFRSVFGKRMFQPQRRSLGGDWPSQPQLYENRTAGRWVFVQKGVLGWPTLSHPYLPMLVYRPKQRVLSNRLASRLLFLKMRGFDFSYIYFALLVQQRGKCCCLHAKKPHQCEQV